MKLTASKQGIQPRYGPVVLTPNPDSLPVEENTPRSTATTRPAVGTQDDDRNGQEEYQPPTVESCLYEAYNFEKEFRERTVPPFPDDEYKKANQNRKRTIQKTHAYRVKRATQPVQVQRQLKWDALMKRARKAATNGRVKICVSFLHFLLLMTWVTRVTQWVAGRIDYQNLTIKNYYIIKKE